MFFDIIVPSLRKRLGKSFRKTLGVFSYKLGEKTHKKPGVIPLNIKQKLIEDGTERSKQIIQRLERNSHYPFGKFTRKSKFLFDPTKVPLYNVPDLTNFELKPYVSYHTPRIDMDLKNKLKQLNQTNKRDGLDSSSDHSNGVKSL